jgi:putative oxidoreductase
MDIAAIARGVFRIGVALLFGMHGFQKLFGLFGGRPVPLASLLGVAGLLEVVGGSLLLLGLLTRPVALILAVEMVAAFVMAHAPRGGAPLQNGGEVPLLYALAFVYFAGNGAGGASLDAVVQRRRGLQRRHGGETTPGRATRVA